MEEIQSLNEKRKNLEETYDKKNQKLVREYNRLKLFEFLIFKMTKILKKELYVYLYKTGRIACVFSFISLFSFMVGNGLLGSIFLSIDFIFFINTVFNSVKLITNTCKNKIKLKKYNDEKNEIMEKMVLLKYQYYKGKRNINEQYLKNQEKNNNLFDYQVNINKTKEKKETETKRQYLIRLRDDILNYKNNKERKLTKKRKY